MRTLTFTQKTSTGHKRRKQTQVRTHIIYIALPPAKQPYTSGKKRAICAKGTKPPASHPSLERPRLQTEEQGLKKKDSNETISTGWRPYVLALGGLPRGADEGPLPYTGWLTA